MLVYDAGCGFCCWSARWILAWDRTGRVRAVALQDPEADRLLAHMDPPRRNASWHLVDETGWTLSGGAAVGPLLRRLPGGRPLAVLAQRFPAITDRLYGWIARRRGRLSTLLRTRPCSGPPAHRGRHE